MSKEASPEDRKQDRKTAKQRLDELLDEALRETFPASDVPSVANPELDEQPEPGDDAKRGS